MKVTTIISILFFCAYLNIDFCMAQRSIVTLSEPEEVLNELTGKEQSVLVIFSPIETLTIESNMGDICNTGSPEKDKFKYTLNIKFSPDELDGTSAITRIVKVKSEYGEANIRSKFQPGKQYQAYFEVPPEFAYADESVSGGIFASDQAKISFVSKLKGLDLYYNNQQIVSAGKVTSSIPAYITVQEEEDCYNLLFKLDGVQSEQASFKHPKIKITHKDENNNTNQLNIVMKEGIEIGPKTSLKYRIFYKNIIAEKISFDELLKKAETHESRQDYEAAKNTYQEAMDHIDFPIDRKEEIRSLKQRAEQARKLTFVQARFEKNIERLENELGFNSDSTYIYCSAVVKVNQDMADLYPNNTDIQNKLTQSVEKLYKHPKSTKVEKKVAVNYKQIISGKVEKEESFVDDVAGVEIYASHERKPKMKDAKNMQRLGRVSANGTYKIMFQPPVSYLYFYGAKQAFPITESTEKLDVVLE